MWLFKRWLFERLLPHVLFFIVVLIGDARYKYVGQGAAAILLLSVPILALISILALILW